MSEVFSQVAKDLGAGVDVCLATIVNQLGSAPRTLGTNFLVRADGSIFGTIGGGRLEAEVMAAAGRALAEERSAMVHIRLKGSEVAETEMICGGDVDVYLEPLYARDGNARQIYEAAARVHSRGGKALMVTPLRPGPMPELAGRKLFLSPGSEPLGSLGVDHGLAEDLPEGLENLLDEGRSGLMIRSLPSGKEINLFLEPMASTPMVYILGGGHVSLPLARLITTLDFKLVVCDDREEFANAERFPEADEVWVRDFRSVLDEVDLGPDAYVVIVTRGHIFDKDVLAQALKQNPAYVGMIGSRRKRDMIYQALLQEGYSQEKINQVHSPIGLSIGAETPEEIAVSVAAELIQVRAAKHSRSHVGPGV